MRLYIKTMPRKDGKREVKYAFDNGKQFKKVISEDQLKEEMKKIIARRENGDEMCFVDKLS